MLVGVKHKSYVQLTFLSKVSYTNIIHIFVTFLRKVKNINVFVSHNSRIYPILFIRYRTLSENSILTILTILHMASFYNTTVLY